jgi:hypothetical protein
MEEIYKIYDTLLATSSALLAGMHIGFGLLNFYLELQQWAWEVSRTVIYLVIISWYVGAILGLILGKFLLRRQEKVVIGVSRLLLINFIPIPKSIYCLVLSSSTLWVSTPSAES